MPTQPNEPTLSIPPECPVCGKQFKRVQERDRHVESHLPHSIYCPFQDCSWTGRRQWDFKVHWGKHQGVDQVPGKEKNVIYEPKEYVRSILDGTSPVASEVVRSALLTAKQRLRALEKVGANVLGRKLDIEI